MIANSARVFPQEDTPAPVLPQENTPAVVFPQGSTPTHLLYPTRFYILGIFSFLAFNQCAFWLTFSPVSPSTQIYYNIPSSTVDLLLNWGPIIFIPTLPLVYLLLNKRNGLRRAVIVLAIAGLVSTALRVIPSIVTSPSSPRFKDISLPFLHAGQIINAACGPLVMAPVSQLSCLWFGPGERTRATTLAIMANVFGSTVSFLVNPAVVSRPSNLPYLLYFHLALAFVGAVITLIYFPAQPPTPPSVAAELLMQEGNQSSNSGFKDFMKGLRTCMTNLSFVLLSTAGGIMNGTFAVWAGLFSSILYPEYTETQAGWFGFCSSLAGIIGALCLGALADTPRFRRRLKMLILISFIGCFLSVLWLQLSVRSIFYDAPILGSTQITIGLSLLLAGLFQGAVSPLIYEGLAEIMYPLPESLSASILVQWNNIACISLLFVASGRYKLINLLVLIVIALSIIMTVFARITYRRQDEEERKKNRAIIGMEMNENVSTIEFHP
ncbi:unnamed protein product [Adineta steineri]|uniref:Uncharacterized protein n=1 Tax=Adineta steineri TaxID=433720 RepID=A0A820AI03_9BILA|nr:unnamed protein product [Adineta steineri]CAF4185767.1 unnamed protein product [Adineta steineri]